MVQLALQAEVKILIASPGDLGPERTEVDSVLKDISETFLRGKNIRISDIRWETDTYTKYGADPQFIINSQILDDYDAILVMFWGRIGTQTPRSISGTVEELNRAVNRHKRTGRPHIMCYFKRGGLDPLSIDPQQVKHVQDIHKGLKSSGLIFEFVTVTEFQTKFKKDIILWLEREVITNPRPPRIRPSLSSLKKPFPRRARKP